MKFTDVEQAYHLWQKWSEMVRAFELVGAMKGISSTQVYFMGASSIRLD